VQKNSWRVTENPATGDAPQTAHAASCGSHPRIWSTAFQSNVPRSKMSHTAGSGSFSAKSRLKKLRSMKEIFKSRSFKASTTVRPPRSINRTRANAPGSKCPASFDVIFRALTPFATIFPYRFVKIEYRASM
jgi:hypothetical protein